MTISHSGLLFWATL